MTKRIVRTPGIGRQPWLDIVSYGRRGHRRPDRFTPAQLKHIALIVRRAPEVMVKVSGGGTSLGAVAAHAKYIGRHGKVEILTDDGERLAGKDAAKKLTGEWDLKNREGQYGDKTRGRGDRLAPKLVYNIVLSMPKLTDPEKLTRAASAFARETFALNHRYAFALHTDTDHPHVHLVVKAASEEGKRLHIKKATLRTWREVFAEKLRAQGVLAAATPSLLRGRPVSHLSDGAYRRNARGDVANRGGISSSASWSLGHQLQNGRMSPASARRTGSDDWVATLATLRAQGASALAAEVTTYVEKLNRPMSIEPSHVEQAQQERRRSR
jgi:hypothetical protein